VYTHHAAVFIFGIFSPPQFSMFFFFVCTYLNQNRLFELLPLTSAHDTISWTFPPEFSFLLVIELICSMHFKTFLVLIRLFLHVDICCLGWVRCVEGYLIFLS